MTHSTSDARFRLTSPLAALAFGLAAVLVTGCVGIPRGGSQATTPGNLASEDPRPVAPEQESTAEGEPNEPPQAPRATDNPIQTATEGINSVSDAADRTAESIKGMADALNKFKGVLPH